MKRDMDLVRTLLLKVEQVPMRAGDVFCFSWDDEIFDVEGYDRDTCIRHFDLLMEAGYIASGGAQGMTDFVTTGLSWQGHEFLDAVRDEGAWKKTKDGASTIGSWSVGLLVDLAKAYAKQEAKKRLGLEI